MTSPATLIPVGAVETYLDPATLPYAFCPGCSHGVIVDQLDAALTKLQLDPHEVVVVSDIGCAGIADKYFATHAFHGLHGRSLTYATGIKLANPALNVIVLIGDGGCGIGGHHLLNAARRNIGVTVVVFNNLNFGMTGGQYSVTTPIGGVTSTTPGGHLERPLDIAGTVAVNGAGFVARTTAYDPELPDLLAEAVSSDGFALLDVWEMCTAYYVPRNKFNRGAIEETMTGLGYEPGAVRRDPRVEYSAGYRAAHVDEAGQPALPPRPLPTRFASTLERPVRLLLAGAAGQRVRTAASTLAAGGVMSGLWATRRDDYPITVRTGHSLAEVILSPTPVLYTGVDRPDATVLMAAEGVGRVRGLLERLSPDATVYRVGDVGEVDCPAPVRELPVPDAARGQLRKNLSIVVAARIVQELGLYPLDALSEAARHTQRPEIAALNTAAIEAATATEP